MQSRFFLFLTITFLLLACGDLKKVQKSDDLSYKLERAIAYYEKGECYNALSLFDQLKDMVRGSQRAEAVAYYEAQTHYCLNDYIMANYYFNSFAKTYPQSSYTEECLFLAAICDYNLSPRASLDQEKTRFAIDEFQIFLNRFPNSTLKDSCNNMVAELRAKIEDKEFAIAKQYAHTGRHKAAVLSLERTLKEYPDSRYKQEMIYLQIKSGYELASNSISEKKSTRYDDTIESCSKFVRLYPQSKWLREVESYLDKCLDAKEELNELSD